jgi:hypothetical protein
MFQTWRLELRQAEDALKQGRLEEAGRLACRGNLQEFLPAQKLLGEIAARLAERGRQRTAGGETSAGWNDVELAARFGADAESVSLVRRQMVDAASVELERYLAADEPQAALDRLDALERRHIDDRRLRELRQVAQDLADARRLARQGRFAEADARLAAAAALRADLEFIAARRPALEQQAEDCRRIAQDAHRALAAEDWSAAQGLADQWLNLAPDCGDARSLRQRAWAAVGGGQGQPGPATRTVVAPPRGDKPSGQSSDVLPAHEPGPRFIAWVDGVGGYLVCEGNEVVLGPPLRSGGADVPLLGDISRHHAVIRRDGEGYVIVPRRDTKVNGATVTGPAPLVDGALVQLGPSVQLRFRRPHPLSATARLEFASGHRTQPSVDAVLLLAETVVLGPGPACHIECRDWSGEMVLFRDGPGLACRREGGLEVDGLFHEGQAPVTRGSRIAGNDFSLSLEALA